MMRALVLFLLAFFAVACGRQTKTPDPATLDPCLRAPAGEISVVKAWMRPARADAPTAAAYFIVCNRTDEAANLQRATTQIAQSAELHETSTNAEGVVSMARLYGVTIPAKDKLEFAPGGLHLMLIGLSDELAAGSSADITLEFERHPPVAATVSVNDASAEEHAH